MHRKVRNGDNADPFGYIYLKWLEEKIVDTKKDKN
jgi:hypothetical protein